MSSPHGSTDQRLLAHWETVHAAVAGAYERILERIEATGVPRQWFAVVHLLHGVPDHRMPMSRLARELMMTSGGFTKLADRMGREGLIDRRGSEGDRRVVFATLTTKGIELAARTEAIYLEAVRETVLGTIPAAQLAQLATDLAPLQAAMDSDVQEVTPPDEAQSDEPWDPSQPERRQRAATSAAKSVPLQAAHPTPL